MKNSTFKWSSFRGADYTIVHPVQEQISVPRLRVSDILRVQRDFCPINAGFVVPRHIELKEADQFDAAKFEDRALIRHGIEKGSARLRPAYLM